MTVSSELSRKTFAGDDATTSFGTSPVVFFDTSDLEIRVTTDSTGVSTLLVEGTDYTVTGGDGSTGTVSLAGGSDPWGALLSGTTLVILRVLPITQGTDFVNNDGADAEAAEDTLDKLTMIAQQMEEQHERALVLPPGDVSGASTELPTPAANSIFGWNAAGTALVNYVIQAGTSLVDLAASAGASLIGFINSGSGAVPLTVQEVLALQCVTPQQFNAEGDGVTDDTTAFNAALVAAGATGKALFIPAGTYLLGALTVPAAPVSKSLQIIGAGRGSILKCNVTGRLFDCDATTAEQKATVLFRDLAFDNVTNTPAAFIRVTDYLNVIIEKCYFSDCAATHCIDVKYTYGLKIRDCVFSDVTGIGVILRDDGASSEFSYQTTIDGCDFTRCSGDAIEIEGCSLCTISNTVIENGGAKGINAGTAGGTVQAWGLVIENSRFESNADTDINLQSDSSRWCQAVLIGGTFLTTPTIALGSKSKLEIIGAANSGGNVVTVSGSGTAAVQLGVAALNFTKSGTFTWTNLGNDTANVVSTTPTWSSSGGANTLGDGTISMTYSLIGNICHWRLKFIFGSTSSATAGVQRWSMPFTSSATHKEWSIGNLLDSGTANYVVRGEVPPGQAYVQLTYLDAAAAPLNVTEAAPFTWATGDELNISGTFLVA